MVPWVNRPFVLMVLLASNVTDAKETFGKTKRWVTLQHVAYYIYPPGNVVGKEQINQGSITGADDGLKNEAH